VQHLLPRLRLLLCWPLQTNHFITFEIIIRSQPPLDLYNLHKWDSIVT